MNYAPKNRQTPHFQSSRVRTGMSVPIKIIMLLLVILALLYSLFPRVLPSLFLTLVDPLWKADFDSKLGTASIEDVRKAYAGISGSADKNSALLVENQQLKDQLGRSSAAKPLLAGIIKKPPFSAYDSFILDVGSEHGVAKGDRVYVLGNIPIGEITEVFTNTSRVELYSSFGRKFDILIGPSSIQATAVGKGGGNFEVSLPRDTKIKKGDQVFIPSLNNNFLGTVDGIASAASEPFAKILFHQPVNIYEGRWVIVDTSTHE